MFRTEKKLGAVKRLISIYRSVDVKIYIYFNSDVTVRLDNLSGPQHAGFGLRAWVFWLTRKGCVILNLRLEVYR